MVGRTLDGRYRIVRPLAKGGMGAVFVAEHVTLQKEVALKVVRTEFTDNPEITTRFAREAMAMAQFEHPHVASAIDYGDLPEGGTYFVMQLVRGSSLRKVMKDSGPMPWRRACAIGAQVADALSAAKSSGIVHRDLKPDNVLVEVREDGSDLVKILDFGIARMDATPAGTPAEAKPGEALTRVGMVMGTPGYMAPEQAIGDVLDHRADLYALGVVLWEAVTGRELWTGGDITALITRQIQESPPRLREVTEDTTLPIELDELVDQLLCRKASERPDHPGDVRDALRALSLAAAGNWGETQPGLTASALGKRLDEAWASSSQRWQEVASPAVERFPWLKRHATPPRVASLFACLVLGSLGLIVISAADDDEDSTRSTAPVVSPEASDPPSGTAKSRSSQGDEEAAATAKLTADQVAGWVAAARDIVTPALKVLGEPAPRPIPEALQSPVKTMLGAKRARARRTAARTVLNFESQEDVPEHIVAIARLEAANTCSRRRKALEGLAKLADVRTRPSVERYKSAPRRGCGFLGLSDCYSCIRTDVRDTLKALPPEPPPPAP